jgi:hypothetical protein
VVCSSPDPQVMGLTPCQGEQDLWPLCPWLLQLPWEIILELLPLHDHLLWSSPTQTMWQSVLRLPEPSLFLVFKLLEYLCLKQWHLAISLQNKGSNKMSFFTEASLPHWSSYYLPDPHTWFQVYRKLCLSCRWNC